MPELPEVETVRRTLISWCKGKKILDVNIHYFNVLDGIDFDIFKSRIMNQTINDISRFGKYLFFILDDYVIISHLRMEGKYFFIKKDEENDYIKKHKIITFDFGDHILIYHDVRKFGKMKLASKDKYMLDKSIIKLGKEPFDLSSKELYDKLCRLNKSIKQSLLDQSIMSGLGNIYVDEVLYDCCIMPTRSSKDISLKDCEKIIASSIKILNKAKEGLGIAEDFWFAYYYHAKNVVEYGTGVNKNPTFSFYDTLPYQDSYKEFCEWNYDMATSQGIISSSDRWAEMTFEERERVTDEIKGLHANFTGYIRLYYGDMLRVWGGEMIWEVIFGVVKDFTIL